MKESILKWAELECKNPPRGYSIQVHSALCCPDDYCYELKSVYQYGHNGFHIVRWCGSEEDCKSQCETDLMLLGVIK